jgi:hypothetical protein
MEPQWPGKISVLQGEISQVKKGGARISSNCAVLLAGSVQGFITSNQANL